MLPALPAWATVCPGRRQRKGAPPLCSPTTQGTHLGALTATYTSMAVAIDARFTGHTVLGERLPFGMDSRRGEKCPSRALGVPAGASADPWAAYPREQHL